MPSPDEQPGAEATSHATHDWASDGSLSATVVEAVAESGSETRSTLPPLGDAINTEALDALFDTATADGPVACVTFAYAGHTVVVQSTGRVLVRRD